MVHKDDFKAEFPRKEAFMSTNRIGFILLALWLILTGLLPLLNVSFSGLELLMGLLAIAAGALLIWKPGKLSGPRNLGILLLGIWLLLTGLIALLSLSFRFSELILNLLAIAAGALLLASARS